MKTKPRSTMRRGAATLALSGLLLAIPVAASAHVKVSPDTAVAGSYATVNFRVPTEKADASTVKLEVDLPTDHPFTSVSYQPVPGWTAKITTSKLATPVKTESGTITEAPTKVVWTAGKDAQIKPGQFQQFPVSLGVVPDVASVSFKAIQTYSDGSVVKWVQPAKADGSEPEHPAPVLTITQQDAAETPAASGGATAVAASAAQTSDADNSSGTAEWLGVGGIAVGVIALLVAVYAVTRRAR